MEKIDFVIPWVDGNDENWKREFWKYNPEKDTDSNESRYRDWGMLPYWFRSVEKFAPWVNRIWFVTWGHVPAWLNTDHEKLRIVRHEDYLKPEYLPTFNSHTIELNFHRIEGLAVQFVYFNDDMFLLQPVKPEDFFVKGLPRDCCIETALAQDRYENPFAHILMNDSALVNMHYQKHERIRRYPGKWFSPAYGMMALRNLLMLPYREFSGFKFTHQPSPFLKETFERLWQEEGERLDIVCRHKFRSASDVNQYVMKYWQYMEGKFVPQSPKTGRFCIIGKDDEKILKALEKQDCKTICLNDEDELQDFEERRKRFLDAFRKILPESSSFEK